MSNVSTDSSSVSPENQLAADLINCAMLVKKGDKSHVLLRQTLHKLTDYLTLAAIPVEASAAAAATAPSGSNDEATTSHAPQQQQQVSRPHHSATALLEKVAESVGLAHPHASAAAAVSCSNEQKQATSVKNASRIKADLANQQPPVATPVNWCSIHFCQNCLTCRPATKSPPPPAAAASSAASVTSSSSRRTKPAFSRPTSSNNSSSNTSLLATGWLEQQRRSKMRVVWKQVLASLVEARHSGEETTLWIQREVQTQLPNGHFKTELEALHQIPVKWLDQVIFHEYSAECKFTVKVQHLADEFIFRCPNNQEAALNWVVTLRSLMERARATANGGNDTSKTGLDELWEDGVSNGTSTFVDDTQLPVRDEAENKKHEAEETTHDLSDTHATTVKVAPPESAQRLSSAESVARRRVTPPPPAQEKRPEQAPSPTPSQQQNKPLQQQSHPSQGRQRMAVSELRAIAHGAGVQTVGMERAQLEEVVRRIQAAQQHGRSVADASSTVQSASVAAAANKSPSSAAANSVAPSPPAPSPTGDDARKRQSAAEEATARQRKAQEEARIEAAQRANLAERSREHAAAAADKSRRDEEERRRLAQEREQRDAEELRRRIAEKQAADVRRKAEEAQRQAQENWQKQQKEWQRQQAEDEQRRRQADAQAAAERKRQEQAYQKQQWQSQQQRPPHQQQQQQPQYPSQRPQWQHPGQPHGPNGMPPGQYPASQYPGQQQQNAQQQGHPPFHNQQQSQQQRPGFAPQQGVSQASLKYAKMAHADEGERTMNNIKHGILIQWALVPPMLQVLRPIDELIVSIQTVFPPNFGVPGHEYFAKWKPISTQEISQGHSMGNRPDEAKLKKAMRKLRFFLHPDKLPNDLNKEQAFMCKMLWDIVSDAESDWKKKEEELGWINS